MSIGLQLASTTSSAGTAFGEMLPWLAGLGVLVVVGAVVIYLLRRSLGRGDAPPEGFTLQDLREMRAAGRISDAEFAAMRAAIIGRLTEEPRGPSAAGPDSGREPPPPPAAPD